MSTWHLNHPDTLLAYALDISAEVTDMDIVMEDLVNLKRFTLPRKKGKGVDKWETRAKSIELSFGIVLI